MGLSGRKEKQRIGKDPRNLSWADDASRFGSSYLSKFGWDASKGLGVEGEGRVEHVKVKHKLDLLGIGAGRVAGEGVDGIAWKQSREFESLLKRLNEEKVEKKEEKEEEMKKEEKEEVKEEEKEKVVTKPLARHRSHRAKAIAAKRLAAQSSTHLSEILGIAPSSSSSSSTPTPKEEPVSILTSAYDEPHLQPLTISTKSVSDYFAEKLGLKSRPASTTPVATATTPSVKEEEEDGGEERPRMGLGMQSFSQTTSMTQFGALESRALFSSLSLKVKEEEEEEEVKEDVEVKKKKRSKSKAVEEVEVEVKAEEEEDVPKKKKRSREEKESRKAQKRLKTN